MASKSTRFEFSIPRQESTGRYYVWVTEYYPLIAPELTSSSTYALTDKLGITLTFDTQAQAWDAAKAWEKERESEAGQP